MRLLLPLLLLTVASTDGPTERPARQEASDGLSVKAVKIYLEKKYSGPEGKNSRLGFDPGTETVELNAPALRRHLPGTRFYLTKLSTGFLSYREVEAVVAATSADGKITSRECLCPIFMPVSQAFLDRFLGLQARTGEERKQLGDAIGELIRRITPQGELRAGRVEKSGYSVELWARGRSHWRDLILQFDSEGRLTSIKMGRR
jgi:hypothetical protein